VLPDDECDLRRRVLVRPLRLPPVPRSDRDAVLEEAVPHTVHGDAEVLADLLQGQSGLVLGPGLIEAAGAYRLPNGNYVTKSTASPPDMRGRRIRIVHWADPDVDKLTRALLAIITEQTARAEPSHSVRGLSLAPARWSEPETGFGQSSP
jgi:hypothetical protein